MLPTILALALLGTFIQPRQPLEQALAAKKWQRRVILLYARAENSVPLATQKRLLAEQQSGLDDRDIDVITVLESELAAPDKTYLLGGDRRLSPTADFAGFLIGKDGGVKQRFTRPTHPTELFRLIDTMPMRQSEMKHK